MTAVGPVCMTSTSSLRTGRRAAVEVTAAADPDSIELWRLINGRGERCTVPDLRGGWMLHLEPTARAKRLLKDLPAFLAEREEARIIEIPSRRRRKEVPGCYRDAGS